MNFFTVEKLDAKAQRRKENPHRKLLTGDPGNVVRSLGCGARFWKLPTCCDHQAGITLRLRAFASRFSGFDENARHAQTFVTLAIDSTQRREDVKKTRTGIDTTIRSGEFRPLPLSILSMADYCDYRGGLTLRLRAFASRFSDFDENARPA